MPDLPSEIDSGCPELDRVWSSYAAAILDRPGVLIADNEDALNWHAFLGHSLDMQGFRAAEFVGVDALTRNAPDFIPLIRRGIGVPELAALWDIPEIREHFLTGTKGVPFSASLDVLDRFGGEDGSSLAEAFRTFPWRKFHWAPRALLSNSAILGEDDHSFRGWLESTCRRLGAPEFPPSDFRQRVAGGSTLELALREELQRTFYMVGPAMAAYMICDWQLWLWAEERTAVFATFKLDSFHESFVAKYGRGVVPDGEQPFVDWWLGLFPELPPRIANECIWIGMEHGLV